MTFDEALEQVRELLHSKGRVAYRALKRRFDLDDEYLEDLKAELIDAEQVARDEDGKVLVWIGGEAQTESENRGIGEKAVASSQLSVVQPQFPTSSTQHPSAERRQLTVMFCDLVGSTALSAQLDPEELREIVRAYQETCTTIIQRYDGHIAQHLGDGLLVYFGHPAAHEDDAARAVRAGLEIIEALRKMVPSPLAGEEQSEGTKSNAIHPPHPNLPPQGEKESQKLQVRIGIHTGPVVIGAIGGSGKLEILALGETPNIAARVQGQAEPNTVFISAATYLLVEGLFECEDRGQPALKGVSTPLTLYQALKESEAQSRFQVVVRKGLTPLVGREHELGLLHERWERVRDGEGQVVLVSGEPGIGKSRLVEALKDSLKHENVSCLELRCSPYHQNSALYPVIEHLQRLLQFERDDSPEEKLKKLESARVGAHGRAPLQPDAIPLLAALLSLPHPENYPPLTLSPQKQKQKTQEALVARIVEEAERQAVFCAWEDLHWADPSTLELLTLFLEQVPTARLLAVLTFRPDFTPSWRSRSHITQLTLNRLSRQPVEAMIEQLTNGKALPGEVVQQIVNKTDGVPLFVEELTKSVIEFVGATGRSPLQLAIPTTLQDSLMARLDRLGAAKEIAQVGATIGREFNYDLLQSVSPLTEEVLQQGLRQLVEAELIYQSGRPPRATYLFKHALIQDTAYQSLLKSRRQQLHRQVAHVLVNQFPQTVETQPEIVAHHYTEAGLAEQAIPYWQQAGQQAVHASAHAEAIAQLMKALELLQTLPNTPARVEQELKLQITLGTPLKMAKGFAAPEVEHAYTRALQLCAKVGETPQLFPVLWGLSTFYLGRAEYQKALDLAYQCVRIAQDMQDSALLAVAHCSLGVLLCVVGDFSAAQQHLEHSLTLYDPSRHRSLAFQYGADPGVLSLSHLAVTLWYRGYPDQARQRGEEALALAYKVSHPFNLAGALVRLAELHLHRREWQSAQERAEATITLCIEQDIPFLLALGTAIRVRVLLERGGAEEGSMQIRQVIDAFRAMGSGRLRPWFLFLLAEGHRERGNVAEGLAVLDEALSAVDEKGEREHAAEVYRLKGELTLQRLKVQGPKFKVENSLKSNVQSLESEAEKCFLKAIDIARKQQARALELRSVMSLSRLWQQQGKRHEARQMLAEIYNWFTEGFDTKDLQEAKTLLEELKD